MMVGARKVLISLIGIGLALAAGMAAAQTAAPQVEVPNLVMPRMTTARALYLKNNPEAFTQFKAQLQGRPSGATVANRSQANAPTFGGSWRLHRAFAQERMSDISEGLAVGLVP